MNFVDAILTALSMSIDACTVNVVNGLEEKNMKIRKMLLISFVFGLFQFLMFIFDKNCDITFNFLSIYQEILNLVNFFF